MSSSWVCNCEHDFALLTIHTVFSATSEPGQFSAVALLTVVPQRGSKQPLPAHVLSHH